MNELQRLLVTLVLLSWILFQQMVTRQIPEPILQTVGFISIVGLLDFISVQAARPGGYAIWGLFMVGICSAVGVGVLLAIVVKFRYEGGVFCSRRSWTAPLLWGVLLAVHGSLLVIAPRLSIAPSAVRPTLLLMVGVGYDVYYVTVLNSRSRLAHSDSPGGWS